MAQYEVRAEKPAVHGTYSRDFPPVLSVVPGDLLRFTTLSAGWITESGTRLEGRTPAEDWGHALSGPVEVSQAQPGDTLVVQFRDLRVGRAGQSSGGGGPWGINETLGLADPPEEIMRWQLDPDALTGRNQYGHVIRLQPFVGNFGMPPDTPGLHSTFPPRSCGGNIDCKELVAGSTVYLPVSVPGALFSLGDGHAAQGDGEVAGPALECPMEHVDVVLDLDAGLRLTMPRASTPTAWITFGFDEDLDRAAAIAIDGMLSWMSELYGVNKKQALALATLVVDLHVTQVVNGVRGVHALLGKTAIETGVGGESAPL